MDVQDSHSGRYLIRLNALDVDYKINWVVGIALVLCVGMDGTKTSNPTN